MHIDSLREQIESAAMSGDVELVRHLAATSGDRRVLLEGEPDELTALHLAAAGGSAELVCYLVSKEVGADVQAARRNAFTPLHAAAMNGHADVCRILLDAGANIDAQTLPQGYAALHSAAFAGHVPTIRLLLSRGANARLLNYRNETPAATALRTGQNEAAQVLNDQ